MLVKYNPFSIKKDDIDAWGFVIAEGTYRDVTIQINNLGIKDNSNDFELDFHIISKPDTITDKDLQSTTFNIVVENILNDIIKNALDEYENRESNNSKSD